MSFSSETLQIAALVAAVALALAVAQAVHIMYGLPAVLTGWN